MDVNRSSYWNSCVDFMEPAREQTMIAGIIGLVCSILLMLLLVFEIIFYICRYKTTFLQHLFFYLTIAVALINVVRIMYLGYSAQLSEESCYNLSRALSIIISYCYVAEILTITFINVTFLRAMFKYHFEKSLPSSILPRYCLNRYCAAKVVEVIAMLTIFAGPLPFAVVGIFFPDVWVYFTGLLTDNNYRQAFAIFYGTVAYILLLSLTSTVVVITWFCSLRRKSISKRRMKLVCREFGLIAGILATFLVLVFLLAVLPLRFCRGRCFAALPIVHSCMPFVFLVYICSHINNSRKKAQVQFNNIETILPTAPPSTRISLLSDTCAHAPNFLSPSTAELTEDTPLLTN